MPLCLTVLNCLLFYFEQIQLPCTSSLSFKHVDVHVCIKDVNAFFDDLIFSYNQLNNLFFLLSFDSHLCKPNVSGMVLAISSKWLRHLDTAMQLYMYIETSFCFLVQRSVIEQPFLSYRDIKPGELVKVRWLLALGRFSFLLCRGGGLFSFPLSPLKWSLFALYMKTSSKLLAVGGQRVHYASAIG